MGLITSKINLACGKEYLEGYYNVDDCSMWPDCKVDCNMNIFDIEIPSSSIEEIKVSHFIMYTRPNELKPLLQKWFDWLSVGGKLDIECIDVKKIAKIIGSNASQSIIDDWGLTNMFGNEETKGHKWGWSAKSLIPLLHQAGFSEVKVMKGTKKPNRDFRIIATK